MLYTGTIKGAAGIAITGATLMFFNDQGTRIAQIPVSGGAWQLDSDFDGELLQPGMVAVFSAPGYYEYKISAETIPQTFNVTLTKKTAKLPLLIGGAAAGAALLYLANQKKGKKIFGADTSKAFPSWILPVGVLAGGAFVLYHFFGPDAKQKEAGGYANAAQAALAAEKAAGRGPTISQTQAEGFATQIVTATDDCGTDENSIYAVFEQLNNKADLLLLISTFGVKSIKSCFSGNWFQDTPRNLADILTDEFSSSNMATLNSILQSKGINYTF